MIAGGGNAIVKFAPIYTTQKRKMHISLIQYFKFHVRLGLLYHKRDE